MDMDLPKVPTISADAYDHLMIELSADTQLRRGLMASHHHQSEAFKLGLLAGLVEAQQVATRMFEQPDL